MVKELNGQGLPVRHTTFKKIEISKITALRDTLVYDSDNWSTYSFWLALSSGDVFCFCV